MTSDMRAAWYGRNGPAAHVLTLGSMGVPEPDTHEVRVRIRFAGLNPADVKRRAGLGGRVIAHPRVIPGDDGAGVIDKVGPGVAEARLGEQVWVRFANQRSPFGTSAEYVVVRATDAIVLPDGVPLDVGACLGVPALTAHRAVHADGAMAGMTVLITGGAGAVGSYAVQLARRAGARVIATASTAEKRAAAVEDGAEQVFDYRQPGVADQILEITDRRGVDRIVDVAFGANLHLSSHVMAEQGVIAAYGSDADPNPSLPFYPLMRRGVTVRMISVFNMPSKALDVATTETTELLRSDALHHRIAARFPLEEVAAAHELVESGHMIGKTLLEIP